MQNFKLEENIKVYSRSIINIYASQCNADYSIQFDPVDLTILEIKEITSQGINIIYSVHKTHEKINLDKFNYIVNEWFKNFKEAL